MMSAMPERRRYTLIPKDVLFTRQRSSGRRDVLFERLGCEADQRRLLLHLDVGDDVVHWRGFVGLGEWRMLLFENRRLVGELMRRKSRRMLGLHGKWILVGKVVVGAESMWIEAMELGGGRRLCGVQGTF